MLPGAHTQGQVEGQRMHEIERELAGEEVCWGGFPEQTKLLRKEMRDEEVHEGLEITPPDRLLKRKQAVQEVRPTGEGRFVQGAQQVGMKF